VTNSLRTGTIRTEERSEFLCISKVDFDLVLVCYASLSFLHSKIRILIVALSVALGIDMKRDYSDGLMNKIAAMRTFDVRIFLNSRRSCDPLIQWLLQCIDRRLSQ
jgi:hypothetical protein